jgi:DNA invertase Pin-like site-specific DNA recombinase
MTSEWLGSNRSALAIIRVSSKRQEGNTSHETQENEIRAYCARMGLKLIDVVRIVESAKDSEDRKKYQAAINSSLTREIRHLLFYMYDREARNLTDNEKNEKLVKADLLCIHYVRDSKVLHRGSPDSDFFIRDVQAAANKQFVRNLTAKVVDAMRSKAEQGWYPSNNPPLGYVTVRIKDANGRPLKRGAVVGVDPLEKNVRQVRREFELRALGFSYEQIRLKIIGEGFIEPERVSQYQAGAIEYRLKNPFYEGRFLWRGIEYPGLHELIIPSHHIATVRRLRSGLKLVPRPVGAGQHGMLAGGWIRCGECGCFVVYDPKTKIYRSGETATFHYYRCSNRRRLHASLRGMNIPEAKLWEQLDRAVDAIQISPELGGQLARALNESYREETIRSAQKAQGLKDELRALEVREDRAYDDYSAGVLDPDGYRRAIARVRTLKQDVRSQLEAIQSLSTGRALETAKSVFELAMHAKELYLSRSPSDRRSFLELICSNPVLNGATVEYNLKKPFSTLSEINENGEWRTRLGEVLTDCAGLQGGIFLGIQGTGAGS